QRIPRPGRPRIHSAGQFRAGQHRAVTTRAAGTDRVRGDGAVTARGPGVWRPAGRRRAPPARPGSPAGPVGGTCVARPPSARPGNIPGAAGTAVTSDVFRPGDSAGTVRRLADQTRARAIAAGAVTGRSAMARAIAAVRFGAGRGPGAARVQLGPDRLA